MWASHNSHVESVRDLLIAGADKHALANDGRTVHAVSGLRGDAASAPAIRALLDAAP